MTGMPIVDACMREMNETGYMPSQGRQIVASYLSMDLRQDWRFGAAYFEEMLIDYDVHSNTAGWAYASGLGPGTIFTYSTIAQSQAHDKKGTYIRNWCPELAQVPDDYIHDPWNIPPLMQKKFGLKIKFYDPSLR